MRILTAREASGGVFQEKPTASVESHAIDNAGQVAGSTYQDTRDMYKLGVKQETKA